MNDQGADPDISVVAPTLNEAENVDALLTGLFRAFESSGDKIEVLFADGGSTDGTQEKVQAGARESVEQASSRHHFGGSGLMCGFWFPPSDVPVGRSSWSVSTARTWNDGRFPGGPGWIPSWSEASPRTVNPCGTISELPTITALPRRRSAIGPRDSRFETGAAFSNPLRRVDNRGVNLYTIPRTGH